MVFKDRINKVHVCLLRSNQSQWQYFTDSNDYLNKLESIVNIEDMIITNANGYRINSINWAYFYNYCNICLFDSYIAFKAYNNNSYYRVLFEKSNLLPKLQQKAVSLKEVHENVERYLTINSSPQKIQETINQFKCLLSP